MSVSFTQKSNESTGGIKRSCWVDITNRLCFSIDESDGKLYSHKYNEEGTTLELKDTSSTAINAGLGAYLGVTGDPSLKRVFAKLGRTLKMYSYDEDGVLTERKSVTLGTADGFGYTNSLGIDTSENLLFIFGWITGAQNLYSYKYYDGSYDLDAKDTVNIYDVTDIRQMVDSSNKKIFIVYDAKMGTALYLKSLSYTTNGTFTDINTDTTSGVEPAAATCLDSEYQLIFVTTDDPDYNIIIYSYTETGILSKIDTISLESDHLPEVFWSDQTNKLLYLSYYDETEDINSISVYKYNSDGDLTLFTTLETDTYIWDIYNDDSKSFLFCLFDEGSATYDNGVTILLLASNVSASFTGTPLTGESSVSTQFTDSSTGSPTTWYWDFGDGDTSISQNPEHLYDSPGMYTVSLTVSDGFGNDIYTRVGYVIVSGEGISANFQATPLEGDADLTVRFKDMSTGGPTNWYWDFGDGNTSTEQHPTHKYEIAENMRVRLVAYNNTALDEIIRNGYINVHLKVGFTATPGKGGNPLTVQFTDTTKGGPDEWNWDFGDGNTSTDQNPVHVYTLGRYFPSLTARRTPS